MIDAVLRPGAGYQMKEDQAPSDVMLAVVIVGHLGLDK
jgi:hypothetical protein